MSVYTCDMRHTHDTHIPRLALCVFRVVVVVVASLRAQNAAKAAVHLVDGKTTDATTAATLRRVEVIPHSWRRVEP